MSPIRAPAASTSRVLDAGQSADWGPLSWIANTPAGTSVVPQRPHRQHADPGRQPSWFTPINANGGDIPGNSRYLQYRADLSSTDQGATPALSQVTASYTQGATPPDPPQITDTHPASPANDNNPKVKGTLGGGNPQTVKIFTNASCQGAAAASDTAAQFTGAGITVSVPDDQTTTISATAVDAASHESACSNPFDYAEDSTAPETQIDSGPSGTTNDAGPSFTFSSPDNSASFQCRLDSNNAADWASCSSPKAYSSLADGTHTFEVRAVDTAGNPDLTPATRTFTVDTTPPDTTIDSGPAGAPRTTTAPTSPSTAATRREVQCQLDSGSYADCTELRRPSVRSARALTRSASAPRTSR